MSATEELRRLLDERGVEYETDDAQVSDTEWYYVTKLRDGYHDRWTYEEPPDCDLLVSYQYDLGAEEAITATLGPAARHPKPHEQWATVLLPEIAWGWDDRWPDYLSVAHDAHGEWRVYVPEDTLGSCNCSNNERTSERTGTCVNMDGEADAEWFTCSECNTELRVHEPFDGKSCKWCDLIATHHIDGDEPNNGYDPEPYFDADFFCKWGERKEVDA